MKVCHVLQANCNGCLIKSKQEVSCDLWQAKKLPKYQFPCETRKQK